MRWISAMSVSRNEESSVITSRHGVDTVRAKEPLSLYIERRYFHIESSGLWAGGLDLAEVLQTGFASRACNGDSRYPIWAPMAMLNSFSQASNAKTS